MASYAFFTLVSLAVVALCLPGVAATVFVRLGPLWRTAFPLAPLPHGLAVELPAPEGATVAQSRTYAFLGRQLERTTTRRHGAPQSTGLASAGLSYG